MTINNANNATLHKCRYYVRTRNKGLVYMGSLSLPFGTAAELTDVVYEGLQTGMIEPDTDGLVLMFLDGEDNAPYIREFAYA